MGINQRRLKKGAKLTFNGGRRGFFSLLFSLSNAHYFVSSASAAQGIGFLGGVADLWTQGRRSNSRRPGPIMIQVFALLPLLLIVGKLGLCLRKTERTCCVCVIQSGIWRRKFHSSFAPSYKIKWRKEEKERRIHH